MRCWMNVCWYFYPSKEKLLGIRASVPLSLLIYDLASLFFISVYITLMSLK